MAKTESNINDNAKGTPSQKGLVFDSSICYICQNIIRNPLMCPNCEKLTCKNCIKKWFLMHDYCPYCREPLSMKNIKTSEFAQKIIEYVNRKIEIPNNKEKNMCHLHDKEFEYYCQTCQECLCKECAFVSMEKHANHKKLELNKTFAQNYKMLIELKSKKEDELEEKGTYLQQLLIRLYQAKMVKMKEIDDLAKKLKIKLEGQVNEIKTMILSIKEYIEKKQDAFGKEIDEMGEKIAKYSKAELIENLNEYIEKINKFDISIKKNEFFQKMQFFFSENLTKIYDPPYQTWVIQAHYNESTKAIKKKSSKNLSDKEKKDIKEKKETKETKVTESNTNENKSNNISYVPNFNLYGLKWYLLIEKNEKQYDNFSVFVHIDEELEKPLMTGLKLEIVNKIDESKNLFIEMEEIYRKKNQGWGSENFFQRKTIKEEGFLDEDGKFDIKVSIKPKSYAELYWVVDQIRSQQKKKKNVAVPNNKTKSDNTVIKKELSKTQTKKQKP